MRFLFISGLVGFSSGYMAPACAPMSKISHSQIAMNGGKGFGGGEATRDPEPTAYDPNDPKGKQQAIHKAESFAEYLAKRGGGGGAPAPAPAAPAAPAYTPPPAYVPPPSPAPAAYVPPPAAPPAAPMEHGKGFGGGEATRDPAPTAYDPNDPKGKQQAIHKAESFAEYLAKRQS